MEDFVVAMVVGLLLVGLLICIRVEFRHRKGGRK